MSSPYRVALVGTGGISRAHATACSQTDRANLVAVSDVSQESIDRFAAQFPVDNTYLDLDKMLADESIDIAVICTSCCAQTLRIPTPAPGESPKFQLRLR